ncbi:MAG: hypothetical protein ACRD2O_02535 [Terriglobia bacterium]
MVKSVLHLLDDPSADLLVLSGLVILGVAIVGNLNDRIEPDRGRRMMLMLIGGLCVALGFLVHSNHNLTASAAAFNTFGGHNPGTAAFDPAADTFSTDAVDKYLGKPSAPPDYFGQIQVSAATFLGTWTNLGNVGYGEIREFRIVADGSHLLVHAWGTCKPADCDWGEQQTLLNQGTVSVTFRSPNRVWQFTFVPTSSGELQVAAVGKTAGKPDYHSENLFAKLN